MTAVSLREALTDKNLLGHAMSGPSWLAWRSILYAANGEKLLPNELEFYRRHTGRYAPPEHPADEIIFCVGRRGGKDWGAATVGVYHACLVDHSAVLKPGENGIVLIVAPDTRQARATLRYCKGIISESPVLKDFVESETADTLTLKNGIIIEVRGASFRRVRGLTSVAIIATEVCFWQTDEISANPDREILEALRPTLYTTHGPLFIISSPYAKKGEFYELFTKNYGPEGDPRILVCRGSSREFNPTLDKKIINRAYARDPEAASAEIGANFRDDIAQFIPIETIKEAVDEGIKERPYERNKNYIAFCDPAGGSGQDSFTLAIGHAEENVCIIDAVREVRPKFSPESVIEEFSILLHDYGIRKVTGDRFAGEFPRELFRKNHVEYTLSDRNRSEIYRDALPLFNSRRVRLVDNERIVNQFAGLERRTGRHGKDIIDHARTSKDDLCNSVAGVLVNLANRRAAQPILISTFEYC